MRAAWLVENAAVEARQQRQQPQQPQPGEQQQPGDGGTAQAQAQAPPPARATGAKVARLLAQHLKADARDWRGVAVLAADWYPWLAASPPLLAAALSRLAALYPRGARLPGSTGSVGVGAANGAGRAQQQQQEAPDGAAPAAAAGREPPPLVSRDEAALVSQLLVLARRQLPTMRPRVRSLARAHLRTRAVLLLSLSDAMRLRTRP